MNTGGGAEQRRHPRRRMLKGGRIIFDDDKCVFTCTVRDLSEGGARLKVEAWRDCPDLVRLEITDGPTHECRVVRRTEKELGVMFLDQEGA
jgi:hypothetical protein